MKSLLSLKPLLFTLEIFDIVELDDEEELLERYGSCFPTIRSIQSNFPVPQHVPQNTFSVYALPSQSGQITSPCSK